MLTISVLCWIVFSDQSGPKSLYNSLYMYILFQHLKLDQMFGSQVQHEITKLDPTGSCISGFVKMKGQKDLRSMKKGQLD